MRFVSDLDLHILDLTSTVRQSSSLDTSRARDSSHHTTNQATQAISSYIHGKPDAMVHFLGAVQVRNTCQSSAGEHSNAYLLSGGNQRSLVVSADLPNNSYSQPIDDLITMLKAIIECQPLKNGNYEELCSFIDTLEHNIHTLKVSGQYDVDLYSDRKSHQEVARIVFALHP